MSLISELSSQLSTSATPLQYARLTAEVSPTLAALIAILRTRSRSSIVNRGRFGVVMIPPIEKTKDPC